MYVIGEFREKDATVSAIQRLRANGLGPADLDLFSEEPVELPRGALDRPSRMSLASVSGAILFGTLATAFVGWTQNNYKLVTGGMPIFSFWATGVITYEMTMLGAVLATFGWFLWESGLLRKRDRGAPVPVPPPGAMCLRVRCREHEVAPAVEALRRAGAIDVQRRNA
jgi:hypothetical protein